MPPIFQRIGGNFYERGDSAKLPRLISELRSYQDTRVLTRDLDDRFDRWSYFKRKRFSSPAVQTVSEHQVIQNSGIGVHFTHRFVGYRIW